MRPENFDEIIGQEEAKEKCKILINSYKIKDEAFPHILFVGPSGTGKTCFCRVLANESNRKLMIVNGNSLQKIQDIKYYLGQITEKEIIFIDEIHGLNKKVAELLLTAIEDFEYDDSGQKMELPKFTLIGATTHLGKMPHALRQRFPHIQELREYTEEEMASLVNIKANEGQKLKIEFSDELSKVIARTARRNPRHILNRTEWVKDYMLSNNLTKMSKEKAIEVIKLQGFDQNGLTHRDLKYLEALCKKRVIGLKSLASAIDVAEITVSEEIEPYLAKLGLINIDSNGRSLNMRKYKELGYSA